MELLEEKEHIRPLINETLNPSAIKKTPVPNSVHRRVIPVTYGGQC